MSLKISLRSIFFDTPSIEKMIFGSSVFAIIETLLVLNQIAILEDKEIASLEHKFLSNFSTDEKTPVLAGL
jgi:hypothetical protein